MEVAQVRLCSKLITLTFSFGRILDHGNPAIILDREDDLKQETQTPLRGGISLLIGIYGVSSDALALIGK